MNDIKGKHCHCINWLYCNKNIYFTWVCFYSCLHLSCVIRSLTFGNIAMHCSWLTTLEEYPFDEVVCGVYLFHKSCPGYVVEPNFLKWSTCTTKTTHLGKNMSVGDLNLGWGYGRPLFYHPNQPLALPIAQALVGFFCLLKLHQLHY